MLLHLPDTAGLQDYYYSVVHYSEKYYSVIHTTEYATTQ